MFGEEGHIEHFLFVKDIEMLVYFSFILAFIIFVYGLWRSYKRWTYGGQKLSYDHLGKRILRFLKYGLLQRKLIYRPYEGIMHIFIYLGFLVLLVGTLLRALESDFFLIIFGTRFLTDGLYFMFKFSLDIAGLIAIIGILMAFIRRLFFKSKFLPDTLEDYGILLLLIVILFSGYILDTISTIAYRLPWINGWDPVGIALSRYFSSLPNIIEIYRIVWTFHMVLAVFSVAFIPYTKLYHIIVGGLFNIFFSRLEHPASFKPIENLDEIIESGGIPGAGTLEELSWKERMDYDSCIKCSRCTDNCPAAESGKLLSPMDLMLKLREGMDRNIYDENLVPQYINPEIIWSCVTCGACVYQCPLLIHHVETIIDLRRNLLGKGENVPDELIQVSYNLMRYGNPMAVNPVERENFVDELVKKLGVEIAEKGKHYDYIYWMGCNTSYDPADREIGRALIKILKEADVNFAILAEEKCCGEPARRIGDELMFKELVNMNKELLSKYDFDTLIVNCPHGYNVFKHEYPQYGFKIDVIHHSQLLTKLIHEGKIKIREKVENGAITFHDPCYLGRWNGIFDEPRNVIEAASSDPLIEMPRSRERSFCCGGGGGQLFFEVKRGERISKLRMNEAISTGAKVVGVACPFCKIMLNSEATEDIKVLDIAEILESALNKEVNIE